jgi:hypothetical protein
MSVGFILGYHAISPVTNILFTALKITNKSGMVAHTDNPSY